jgi:Fur family iron response transcriptional regulator
MQATHQPSRQQIIALLTARGVLPTRQRVDIAQLLLSRRQHLSADQVLYQVNEKEDRLSKATVYNTLGLLARKGLIRELTVDPERIVYDSNPSPHHHLYNIDSGELQDIASGSIDLSDLPELPPGTTMVGVDVIVRIRNQG